MKLTIIQPRHVYAHPVHKQKIGHIFFPASVYFAAARFESAGISCDVIDQNLQAFDPQTSSVGLACIGSPYFAPIASQLQDIRSSGVTDTWIGGQGINGLSPEQIALVFGPDVRTLEHPGFAQQSTSPISGMLPQERVSIEKAIIELDETLVRLYFSEELPLYLSQGCRYSCTFCAADRARPASVAGPTIAKRETYRLMDCLARELLAIAVRSQEQGIYENRFYLSNLDLMQNPAKIAGFLDVVEGVLSQVRNHKFSFRGLATSHSFMMLHKQNSDLIERFVNLGLKQIGFGIDGATPEVWKAIRKPHASDVCLESIAVAKEVYGITPEVLMVFGHEGHDNQNSLNQAVDTVRRTVEFYGAIPRPHVAKGLVPGNDGWFSSSYKRERDFLFQNPWAFQFLDFTCLPTDLTHADPIFREAVTKAFLEICAMPKCLTEYVLPEDRRLDRKAFKEAVEFNLGRFDV